jgi:hypothetical protein
MALTIGANMTERAPSEVEQPTKQNFGGLTSIVAAVEILKRGNNLRSKNLVFFFLSGRQTGQL